MNEEPKDTQETPTVSTGPPLEFGTTHEHANTEIEAPVNPDPDYSKPTLNIPDGLTPEEASAVLAVAAKAKTRAGTVVTEPDGPAPAGIAEGESGPAPTVEEKAAVEEIDPDLVKPEDVPMGRPLHVTPLKFPEEVRDQIKAHVDALGVPLVEYYMHWIMFGAGYDEKSIEGTRKLVYPDRALVAIPNPHEEE